MNTPLIPMDKSSKQKINKETQVLNDAFSVIKEEVEMNFRWAKRRESAVTMAHLLDMIDLKVAC